MKTDSFTSFLGWIMVVLGILAIVGAGVSLYASYRVILILLGKSTVLVC